MPKASKKIPKIKTGKLSIVKMRSSVKKVPRVGKITGMLTKFGKKMM